MERSDQIAEGLTDVRSCCYCKINFFSITNIIFVFKYGFNKIGDDFSPDSLKKNHQPIFYSKLDK